MLRFPALFLLLALIAGAFGFGGLADNLAEFFKILLVALLALAALGCILNRISDPLDADVENDNRKRDALSSD